MFNISIKGNSFTVSRVATVVEDSVATEQVSFSFDDSWQGLTKWACFKNNDTELHVLMQTDDEVITVPWEVMADIGTLYIGALGMKGDTVVKPTIWGEVARVVEGVSTEGAEPEPPTPSEIQQVLKVAENAVLIATNAAIPADNAAAAANQAAATANAASQTATAAAAAANEAASKIQVDSIYESASEHAQSGAAIQEVVNQISITKLLFVKALPTVGKTDTLYVKGGKLYYFTASTQTLCPLTSITGTGPAVSVMWVQSYTPSANSKILYATDYITTEPTSMTQLSVFDTVGKYTSSTKRVTAKTHTDWSATWTGERISVDNSKWSEFDLNDISSSVSNYALNNITRKAIEEMFLPNTLVYGYDSLELKSGASVQHISMYGDENQKPYITLGELNIGDNFGPLGSGGQQGVYIDGALPFTFSGSRVVDVGTPENDTDAATKAYVDSHGGVVTGFTGAALSSDNNQISGTCISMITSTIGTLKFTWLHGTFDIKAAGVTEVAGSYSGLSSWTGSSAPRVMAQVRHQGTTYTGFVTLTVDSTEKKLSIGGYGGMFTDYVGESGEFYATLISY